MSSESDMIGQPQSIPSSQAIGRHGAELVRYIINGLVATGVHYSILRFNLEVLGLSSAGLANMLAAAFGITTSFLGSRYFVFRRIDEPLRHQAIKFFFLYSTIALIHGMVLLVWTDLLQLEYTWGFLIATILQVLFSYFGNKFLVFNT